jgi:aldehyde dehydrogenase (NAD+)
MFAIDQLEKLRHYFNSGSTRSYSARKAQLKKLSSSILKYENDLYAALYSDLKKSKEETWVTEIGMVMAELRTAIRYLANWMEPEKVATTLVNFPSSSKIVKEPLGVVLIIGPWNYPFQLLFNPLIGAIAAGNCAVVKPSEFTPATNEVMKMIITETFPNDYILFVEGNGEDVIPAMMKGFRFDHIFFTGSTTVGKLIYKMAAEKLMPVTLELGGKSPCVVESDANINVAARRIAVAKFSNCGQMCVAPDYILVQASVKEKLIAALKQSIVQFFTEQPADNYNYGKIINEKQFNRLVSYLSDGEVIHGGSINKEKLYIAPTLLTNIKPEAAIMKDEIFGPLLPIISFETVEEAKAIIAQHPNPLSFYVFSSSSKKQKQWLSEIPAGGMCINNCSWHLTNHHLPFGGRGFSGIGCYHGKYSFETFSHKKAVMKTPTWFDPAIKYPSLKGKLKLFKWVVR